MMPCSFVGKVPSQEVLTRWAMAAAVYINTITNAELIHLK